MTNVIITLNGETVYPSSALMTNVYDSNGVNLEERLNAIGTVEPSFTDGTLIATVNGTAIKVPAYNLGEVVITGTTIFSNITSLKAATDLTEGLIVETKGYYAINDGGGSKFQIITSVESEDYCDDATLIKISDGIYAELILPASETLNFRQFGARTLEEIADFDCKASIQKYLDYLDHYKSGAKLFIGGGIWLFSATDLVRSVYPDEGFTIFGENSQSNLAPGKTSIAALSGVALDYIWKVSGNNTNVYNFEFTKSTYGFSRQGSLGGTNRVYTDASCPRALIIQDVDNGHFEALYFVYCTCALDISNVTNSYFGYLNIRQSGGYCDGLYAVIRIGDNIEGVYIDYLNAEVIKGNVFYGYGTDDTKPVLFIMNDLLMEATSAVAEYTETDPGYDHNISHWFVFNGKLGSPEKPCILHSASVSNLRSYYITSSASYKSMALFGHETNVPMGFIVGNVYVTGIKTHDGVATSGPWLVYDIASGAKFTFNLPFNGEDACFYLLEADMPLINTYNRKNNILPAAKCEAVRVSYKSGAFSEHKLVGTNNSDEYYVLYSLHDPGLKIRFYNADGISSFTVSMGQYLNNEWTTTETTFTVECSSEISWQTVTIPDLGLSIPTKIRLKGLPKYIDYFMNYEDI